MVKFKDIFIIFMFIGALVFSFGLIIISVIAILVALFTIETDIKKDNPKKAKIMTYIGILIVVIIIVQFLLPVIDFIKT